MGYTKAPVNDTHNTIRLMADGSPFVVSNPLGSVEPESLNFQNCFPLSEKQWATGNVRHTIHKREAWIRDSGHTGFSTSGTALSRCGVLSPDQASYPSYFFAKGATFYEYNFYSGLTNAIYTPASGTVWKSYGTQLVDSANDKRIAFLDPVGYLYTWKLDGTSTNTTDLTARNLVASKGLVFLNGYLFAVDTSGYKIHNSNAAGVYSTWSSTDYLSAEQYADPVMWIDKHKNHLVAFGTNSIEFFYDGAVEVGSPLVRQESYSRQIGIYYDNTLLPGKNTAHIDDDLYFLGTREQSQIGLYRIRNFQVEEIDSQFMQSIVNYSTASVSPQVRGIETIMVNNNPMILININNAAYSLVYFPKEDSWWMLQQSTPTLYDFPSEGYRIGQQWYSPITGRAYFLSCNSVGADTVYVHNPDTGHTTSLSATVWSPVVDFGINFYKHIARVDAIGDFGDNTLTLYYNPAPNYQNDYVTCSPTRAVSTATSDRNSSWYNLGAYRRMSFKLQMSGYSHAVLEGLDIEYNVGMA